MILPAVRLLSRRYVSLWRRSPFPFRPRFFLPLGVALSVPFCEGSVLCGSVDTGGVDGGLGGCIPQGLWAHGRLVQGSFVLRDGLRSNGRLLNFGEGNLRRARMGVRGVEVLRLPGNVCGSLLRIGFGFPACPSVGASALRLGVLRRARARGDGGVCGGRGGFS